MEIDSHARRDRRGRAPVLQLEIEQQALERRRSDKASASALAEVIEREIAELQRAARRDEGRSGRREKDADRGDPRAARSSSRRRRTRGRERRARGRPRARGRDPLRRRSPSSSSSSKRARGEPARAADATAAYPQGGGRRRGHRRGRRASGPASRSRKMLEGEMEKLAPHGGAPARARGRPGRGAQRGRQRDPPLARGPAGPDGPIGSFLFLGPDRRRQDRAGAGAGRVPVRRRAAPWSAST